MKPIIDNIRRAFNTTANNSYDILFEWSHDAPVHRQVILQKANAYSLLTYKEDPFAEIELRIGASYIIEDAYELLTGSAQLTLYVITSNEAVHITEPLDVWIANNQSLISKSNSVTVTVLNPTFTLQQKNDQTLSTEAANTITDASLSLTGSITNQVDELLWYKLFLRDGNRQIVDKTEKVYLAPGKYAFSTALDYDFTAASDDTYDLTVLFSTKQGYVAFYSFPLKTAFTEGDFVTLTIDAVTPNVATGSIDIQLSARAIDASVTEGNMTLLRADSKDNYREWDTVLSTTMNFLGDDIAYQPFKDTTIETGIGYKYKVVIVASGKRQTEIINSTPLFACFEDILLATEDLQLRIAYNPTIENYKYTLGDSITQTLGAPYPYFRRNGAMNYRQFNIGGLIAYEAESDTVEALAPEYGIQPQMYSALDEVSRRTIYERLFREKVISFLNSGDIMLFRSAQEGNIIIRLMNISLTPEKRLGRILYSFTAQAVEVADATLANYRKYNLYKHELQEIIADVYYNNYYIKGALTGDTVFLDQAEVENESLIIHKESYPI